MPARGRLARPQVELVSRKLWGRGGRVMATHSWPDLKSLRDPPVTFRALKAVRDELKANTAGLENRMQGEFQKVRGEMDSFKAAVQSDFIKVFSEIDSFKSETRDELAKVREEMNSFKAKVKSDFANMRSDMNKMLEHLGVMQANIEECNLKSGAVLDVFSIMREKLETNAYNLNENTNRRLDNIEYAVKEMRKNKSLSIE